MPEPKTGWLCCLLVQTRDDTVAAIRCNAELVTSIFVRHRGVIVATMGSLQLVAFGLAGGAAAAEIHRHCQAAAAEALRALGTDLRGVRFSGDIASGNIGASESRLAYSLLLPGFERFLRALLDTEYGVIREFGNLGGSN